MHGMVDRRMERDGTRYTWDHFNLVFSVCEREAVLEHKNGHSYERLREPIVAFCILCRRIGYYHWGSLGIHKRRSFLVKRRQKYNTEDANLLQTSIIPFSFSCPSSRD
jgi:hypothetical protein